MLCLALAEYLLHRCTKQKPCLLDKPRPVQSAPEVEAAAYPHLKAELVLTTPSEEALHQHHRWA